MDIIRFILLLIYIFLAATLYEKYIYPFGKKCKNYKYYYELAREDMQTSKAKRMLKKSILNGCIFCIGHVSMILATLLFASVFLK